MLQVRLTVFTPKVTQINFFKSYKNWNSSKYLKKVINKKHAAWLIQIELILTRKHGLLLNSFSIKTEAVVRRCSLKKVFLKTSQNSQGGKLLCQRLFLNKVSGLRPATLLKKRLWHRCFPVNFAKFSRRPFYTERLRWLLQ